MSKAPRVLAHALLVGLFCAAPSVATAHRTLHAVTSEIAPSASISRIRTTRPLAAKAPVVAKHLPTGSSFHGVPVRVVLVPALRRALTGDEATNPEHDAVLKKLGISTTEPTMETVPSKDKLTATESGWHGLGQTIDQLKTKPYLTSKTVFTPAERDTVAHIAIDHGYHVIDDPRVHLSAASFQNRVDGIYSTLSDRLKKELGVDPKSFGGHIAVVDGGRADSFNAVTLPNGSVIVHQKLVEVAEKVGAATAAAKNSSELVKNLAMVALDKFNGSANTPEARRYADAFLAMVIGHEMTHGMKFHGAIGNPPGEGRGKIGPMTRARETVADGGGLELATRSGFSPLGELTGPLYFSLYQAMGGLTKPTKDDPHPAGIDRYAFSYRYLERRLDAARQIYDGEHPHHDGAAFMTPEMKKEFEELPKPDQVKAISEKIASQVRPQLENARARIVSSRLRKNEITIQ